MRIAVDAMGGDFAPEEIVKGVMAGLSELDKDIYYYLVGNEKELSKFNINSERIEIVHSEDSFEMNIQPTKVLEKDKDYSLIKAASMVKEGKADAMISAGHTGATLVASLTLWGRIPGVKKPGIAINLPGIKKSFVMIDMGAIVDAKPQELLQFAQMAITFKKAMGEESPTVALLSNGEEEKKGNEVVRQSFQLFKKYIPNFIGYVEGTQLYEPKADIVVCDGFNGNIVLKTSEGVVKLVFNLLMKEMQEIYMDKKVCGILFERLSKKLDYKEYGGAILLGVKGICIISHGVSKAKAIKNAIKQAYNYYKSGIIEKMEKLFKEEMYT